MLKKRIILFGLMLVLVLSACAEPEPTPEPTATPVPTETMTTVPSPTVEANAATESTVAPVEVDTPDPEASLQAALEKVEMPEGDVVAVVNGVEISTAKYEKELRRQLEAITAQYQLDWSDPQTAAMLPQVQDNILEQLIDLELIGQLAAQEDITATDEEIDAELVKAKESVVGSSQFESWSEFLEANNLTEEEAREAIVDALIINQMIEAHGGETEVEQVHAAHILVEDEETAQKVLEELEGGADFAELAAEYSTDPGSKEQGGDLGWFPRGTMVGPFEEVAFSLPVGETSDIVETQFGYHIIHVFDREVRELEEDALAQQRQENFTVWYEAERSEADVTKMLDLAPQEQPE